MVNVQLICVGLVQAEGLEQFFSSSLLLELSSSQSSLSKHLSFSFPPDLVMGSEKASVTVVGMSTGKKKNQVT